MEEREEEGLFDKVGTTDHEMPTVLKVRLKNGMDAFTFGGHDWGLMPFTPTPSACAILLV